MTKDRKIRVVIVDDELRARNKIRALLRPHADVEVVAVCENENEALEAITNETPDLVFLDMCLRGGVKGFDMLAQIKDDLRPLVIVVTGKDGFERQAFNYHAVDFLGKPLFQERFDEALSQARSRLTLKRENGTQHTTGLRDSKYIGFKSQGRVFFREKNTIMWITAEGRYVRLNFEDQSPLIEETMESMEARLDPSKFVRIHRSYIANLEYVKELHHMCKQDYVVVMKNGHKLRVSESGRRKIADRLEIL